MSAAGLLHDTALIVVRSEVQSVIDRMKLDVERPELRCRARDDDYRATLERAVARLDQLSGQPVDVRGLPIGTREYVVRNGDVTRVRLILPDLREAEAEGTGGYFRTRAVAAAKLGLRVEVPGRASRAGA